MNDEDRMLLTEYLGECWYDPEWRCCDCGRQFTQNKSPLIEVPICAYCGSPHKDFAIPLEDNRTFTTRSDMMGLYQAIAKKGKWGEFFHHAKDPFELVALCPDESGTGYDCYESDFTTWLFCLDGEGYEERCRMVAEWVKEASHE